MQNSHVKKLTLSAMFIAIGILLPMVTANIPEIGMALLPMHLPVLLAGLIVGAKHALLIGAIVPIARYFIFGMPVLFPMGASMALELATYGLVIGIIYGMFLNRNIVTLYTSLVIAMLAGRIVWGVSMAIFMGIQGGSFSMEAFVTGAFVTAIPGIILQLVLIPIVMIALKKARLIHD